MQLAYAALADFDIGTPRPVFLQHNSGVAYRVETNRAARYLLKIHQAAGRGPPVPAAQLEARLHWLAQLERTTRIAIPAPVPNRSGALVTSVSFPDLPEPFICSLQRWVEGEAVHGDLTLQQTRQVGAMMAALHNAGGNGEEFEAAALPRFASSIITQWTTQLGRAVELGFLTAEEFKLVEQAGLQLQKVLSFGKPGKQPWGCIHGDLHQANLLFYAGEVRPIDFDGLQVAPFYLDIGTTLYRIHYQGPAARHALLAGYRSTRQLPDDCRVFLDAALTCAAMGNLAFQLSLPDQLVSPILVRNLRQLANEFCRAPLVGMAIVDA